MNTVSFELPKAVGREGRPTRRLSSRDRLIDRFPAQGGAEVRVDGLTTKSRFFNYTHFLP